jgi:hypothetical protein
MGHHSKRELIAPEVSAEPVVRDMNVHKAPLRPSQAILSLSIASDQQGLQGILPETPRGYFRLKYRQCPLRFTGPGMSKPKTKNVVYRPPLPPLWKGRDSLDLAFEINQRFFRLASDLAADSDADGWPLTLDRELWSKLDAQAIARAARFPFLVLDVHFTREKWWREVIDGTGAPALAHGWPASVSEHLMSETLVFAWYTAKWDWRVARLSLGMLPAVAQLIAALTPEQLANVSAHHSYALRLRWADESDFWTRLLVAARDGDEEGLADSHLHANLLLSGALLVG